MQNVPIKNQPDIRQVIDDSKEVLIALGKNPSFDSITSGLSLYLALSAAGKHATIVCPSPMTVEFNQLIGVDKVANSISNTGRNLVVSFPYQEGSIEKVSYNIESDVFNLVIEPREGYPAVTPDKLAYSFGGGNFDTIIVIGSASLYDLDQLYTQNEKLFADKQVINIDINSLNQRFGKINFIDQSVGSISEMIVSFLNAWGLRMDADTATNLLAGITAATQNFSSPKSGIASFEAATICMRSGARRLEVPTSYQPPVPQQPYQFPVGTQPAQNPTAQPATNYQQYPIASPNPYPPAYRSQASSLQPKVQPSQTQQRPITMQQPPRPQQQNQQPKPPFQPKSPMMQPKQQPKKQDAPPDWLKPKIYKGSTLL